VDKKATLAPLLAALSDLVSWLAHAKVRGAIIGGVAASLLGRPRLTRDIDAVVIVPDREWRRFLELGATFGFAPRRADALDFAAITRVLLLRHEPSAIDIDLSFGLLPFEEETVARAAMTSIGNLQVPVATAEDLIVMKAVAGRPRDIGDIEGLIAASPKLDRRRIRKLTKDFAMEMDMPEIVERLEPLLASSTAPTRRAKSSRVRRPATIRRRK
jgi:Nucleotidyl transferase of unknown function (DUF2204)